MPGYWRERIVRTAPVPRWLSHLVDAIVLTLFAAALVYGVSHGALQERVREKGVGGVAATATTHPKQHCAGDGVGAARRNCSHNTTSSGEAAAGALADGVSWSAADIHRVGFGGGNGVWAAPWLSEAVRGTGGVARRLLAGRGDGPALPDAAAELVSAAAQRVLLPPGARAVTKTSSSSPAAVVASLANGVGASRAAAPSDAVVAVKASSRSKAGSIAGYIFGGIVAVAIIVLYFVGLFGAFSKCGYPAWYAIMPFSGPLAFCEAGGNMWLWVLAKLFTAAPLSTVADVIIFYGLAVSFVGKRQGGFLGLSAAASTSSIWQDFTWSAFWLTAGFLVLPFVAFPIVALNESVQYDARYRSRLADRAGAGAGSGGEYEPIN